MRLPYEHALAGIAERPAAVLDCGCDAAREHEMLGRDGRDWLETFGEEAGESELASLRACGAVAVGEC